MKNLIVVAGLFLILSGCAEQPTVDQKVELTTLMEVSRTWSNSQSQEELLSYWAEDAIFKAPDHPTLIGKVAIKKFLDGEADIPGFAVKWEPKLGFVSKSGDLGYLIEDLELSLNDSLGNRITSYQKVVTIWKKQKDGGWKNVVDIQSVDPALTSIN